MIYIMKNFIRSKGFLVISLLAVICMGLFWSLKKSGMFLDEIYTYGLSNSHYAPFLTSIKNGNMIDTTFSQQDFFNYLEADRNERFDYGSVYYNQTKDVHPPMYYWLFNTVSSLFTDSSSKWIGLGLNLVLYMLIMFVLYKLCKLLFNSSKNASIAVLLYGLSKVGLSTMLMIRMYTLLTLLTLTLAYLIVRVITEDKKYLYILITVNIFMGLMTQYFFVFYAFFVCVAADVFFLVKKQYKKLLKFSICATVGVICMYLCFPSCINHLFGKGVVSGGTVANNLFDFQSYLIRIKTFAWAAGNGLITAVVLFGGGVLLLVIKCIHRAKFSTTRGFVLMIVIVVPAIVSFVVTAVVAPYVALRYAYNIMPLFVIAVCYVISELLEICGAKKYIFMIFYIVVLALCFGNNIKQVPDYLYPEHTQYDAAIEKYSDVPCIYFNKNKAPSITQDLKQLMHFREVFVTDSSASRALKDYIEKNNKYDKFIVYIDVFKGYGFDNSNEIISDLKKITGAYKIEKLYADAKWSETYVFYK